MKHEIVKVRLEPVRRTLRVVGKEQLTPRMLRVAFHSDDLAGFASPSADDHVKLFLPAIGNAEPIKRDFTPRAWDVNVGSLTLDFVLHEHGPAVEWARKAEVGEAVQIGGPRGSTVVPDDFDWYVLIGDSSALPSFARRLEALRKDVPVHVFVLIENDAEQQTLNTKADCTVQWYVRKPTPLDDEAALFNDLNRFELPDGDGFIWIAAEGGVSRELYSFFVDQRGHPAAWIKASAYWTKAQV